MTHDGNKQSLLQQPGKMLKGQVLGRAWRVSAKTQLFHRARRRPFRNPPEPTDTNLYNLFSYSHILVLRIYIVH